MHCRTFVASWCTLSSKLSAPAAKLSLAQVSLAARPSARSESVSSKNMTSLRSCMPPCGSSLCPACFHPALPCHHFRRRAEVNTVPPPATPAQRRHELHVRCERYGEAPAESACSRLLHSRSSFSLLCRGQTQNNGLGRKFEHGMFHRHLQAVAWVQVAGWHHLDHCPCIRVAFCCAY